MRNQELNNAGKSIPPYRRHDQIIALNQIEQKIVSEIGNDERTYAVGFQIFAQSPELRVTRQQFNQLADLVLETHGKIASAFVLEICNEFREVCLEDRTEDELHAASARALRAIIRNRFTLPGRIWPDKASSTHF